MEPLNTFLALELQAAYDKLERQKATIEHQTRQIIRFSTEISALQQQLANERHEHITLQVYSRHLEVMLSARTHSHMADHDLMASTEEDEILSEDGSEHF